MNPQNPTPHHTHTASDPPVYTQNAHARSRNNTTIPIPHPKTSPPCPTTIHTADKIPHHPSNDYAPPEFFPISCHHPTSCSHTEKKILHDHSTLCALTECALNAPPTDTKTEPPNRLSCQGSNHPIPRSNQSKGSSRSARDAAAQRQNAIPCHTEISRLNAQRRERVAPPFFKCG
jgi:hypothetical protein